MEMQTVLGQGRVYHGDSRRAVRWPKRDTSLCVANPGESVMTCWGKHTIPPPKQIRSQQSCKMCNDETVAACRRAVHEGHGVLCEMVLTRELRKDPGEPLT